MWTSCEKPCAAGASFGSHGRSRSGRRETSPQSKMAHFTQQGPLFLHDGFIFLLQVSSIFLYSIACLHRADKSAGWAGDTPTPASLNMHESVGWMGGREGNGATLGDLSIRRMKRGETQSCFPRSGSMWTSCEKPCAAGASFGSHGRSRAGRRETSPQSKMAHFTRQGPYSCTAGLFLMERRFFFSVFHCMTASS